jgi:hypothetical protein
VWIRCAIDATILYVSIGAQPVPCSLTKSGIAYDFRGKGPGVVRHARTSISAGGRARRRQLWIAHSPSTMSNQKARV